MKALLVCIFLMLATVVTEAQKSVVSGTIKGMSIDTLSIFFLPLKHGEHPISDKVICKDGKLNYEVQLNSSLLHLVRISSKEWDKKSSVNSYPYILEMYDINFFINSGEQVYFMAEPGINAINMQAYGNKINEQRNELHVKLYPKYNVLNAACIRYAAAKTARDSLLIIKEEKFLESMRGEFNQETVAYILKHPDWDYSAEVLLTLPTDSCLKYFEKLSPKVRSSFFGQYVRDFLFAQKVGDQAIPFTLPDPQGNQVSLSDYKGKYVAIDFWGTWCGYCVADLPKMKQYHDQYKDKIEFISIACRDSQKSWKEAIKKYKMNWTNLLNPDDQLTVNYGIEGYPTKLILDPNGKVIGKYLGEGRDFYTRLDELFKKLTTI